LASLTVAGRKMPRQGGILLLARDHLSKRNVSLYSKNVHTTSTKNSQFRAIKLKSAVPGTHGSRQPPVVTRSAKCPPRQPKKKEMLQSRVWKGGERRNFHHDE